MKEIKLSTEVSILQSPWKISHQSRILTIGSCFAEVLGRQLREYQFTTEGHSLGTIFNPLTICKTINAAIGREKPSAKLYLENQDEVWLHHDYHSAIWAASKKDLEEQIADKLENVRLFLKETNVLVITLGTAYAYRHKATNQIIGNCHKLPADQFIRELLHPDQISQALEQLIQQLLMFRREMHVILTVSPVRHTRDTLPLNQVSKSTLRLVCHRLIEKYKHVSYFPSYEIMLDELRDYRFYKEDMIHPNKTAEDYIFDKFGRAYFSPDTQQMMREWESIRQAIDHKPLHGTTHSYYKHLLSTKKRLEAFSKYIDVADELLLIEQRLIEFPRR